MTTDTLQSRCTPLGEVVLPPYQGRQLYMHTTNTVWTTMPKGFTDYTLPVMDLLRLAGVPVGVVHVTVDEKIVQPGMSQRRPGPHVDGCFVPSLNSWANGAWAHGCNNIATGGPIQRMAVIVAASVAGCRVFEGEFEGEPKDDGDLSHIQDQLGEGEVLSANTGYLLSPDCVHESMTFENPTTRTFLRIALETTP